jgi:hypothetical protein
MTRFSNFKKDHVMIGKYLTHNIHRRRFLKVEVYNLIMFHRYKFVKNKRKYKYSTHIYVSLHMCQLNIDQITILIVTRIVRWTSLIFRQ